MAIIEVNHVTKEYRLGALHGFKQTVHNTLARLRGHPVPERPLFKALDDVDFKVEEGEVLGIIGHNGAGKSTLLKMLANISVPTRGNVKVHGKVAPLIEVGAGLVGDLAGRENIYLNGAILGIPKTEIKRKFDEIVSFAELEEFIDTPIKRYSSGMKVRLGFAIATSADADILIVDEVLAVGDLAFQRKCFDRMEDMIKRQGKTVLLVSHNIRQVERLCTRVLMLDRGKIAEDGAPNIVCNKFLEQNNIKIKALHDRNVATSQIPSQEITLVGTDLLDDEGNITDKVKFLDPCRIRIALNVLKPLNNVTFYIGIHTTDFVYLTANNTAYHPVDLPTGRHEIELRLNSMTLLPGVYCFFLWVGTPEGRTSFREENISCFQVISSDYAISRQRDRAVTYIPGQWKLPGETRFIES